MPDDIDKLILAELRQDARIPVTSLAQRVGRSRTAVQARVDRLESSGRIQRYTIDEPGHTRDSDVGAVVMIQLKVRNRSNELMAQLRAMPQVIGCYGIAGDFDFTLIFAKMENEDLKHHLEAIYSLDAVRKTQTHLALYREF
ncbi:Lrp/AsnC family transcriptional regulator [Cochlodiniinecator piscidefendens]|uniref:Lrp/AsnC family transcriptional regulator n=1 Tax=Cochlodiniinecator piscidefendens TaxID=2715756 RepID=UPI001408E519|nr:AsnC family transcriptional regulator [Cochlodiniinecator piscidefendens]